MAGGSGFRTLVVAAAASTVLALGKFGLGLFTGSLVLMASAADSFADALMSGANAWGYRYARVPADADHPYGHGKFEGAFAVGQGMLLLGIVVSLVASCGVALVEGHERPRVGPAVAGLALSAGAALALTWLLGRAGAREGSVVLLADTAHYKMDALAAGGAIGGLLLVEATGRAWLDPAASLVMALLMAREAARVLRRGVGELLDEALPDAELAAVQAVLDANADRVVAFHGLRTRRAGPLRFVEVHAVLAPGETLGAAHELVQDLGRRIAEALPSGPARVLVHPDAEGFEDVFDRSLEGRSRG